MMKKTYTINGKELSLKQAREKYNISYKNVVEVNEQQSKLWVYYKNNHVSVFQNVHGCWGFPCTFVWNKKFLSIKIPEFITNIK